MISWKNFKLHARDLLHLGLPILLGQLAQMSMNFVDSVVAGKAGTAHMAGVSIGCAGAWRRKKRKLKPFLAAGHLACAHAGSFAHVIV